MTSKIIIPNNGESIHIDSNLNLQVPDRPIIPYITGDGIGEDITPPMQEVVSSAIRKAYGATKEIIWMEVFAGEKATKIYGENIWLPDETIKAMKDYVLSIKGPLATPVGGGIRSLNVALRQQLDLYVCLRPIRYFEGVPSPLKRPADTNMVIFRENTEDIYAGIEYESGSNEANMIMGLLDQFGHKDKIRFPNTSAIGIKPVSVEGSQRLIKRSIEYAIATNRKSVTLVHKGNIMKFTEGGFKEWGYELAKREFGAIENNSGVVEILVGEKKVVIKDMIADAFLQEILLNPMDHDVVATLNLNGDYISDALAAQVGGIGISPGANLSDSTAIFEATHGTAPAIAGKNIANPSSLILSAEMMLTHMGWADAADILISSFEKTLKEQKVTADFSSQISGCKPLSTIDFSRALISNM
ncbi:MAG: isocitrate dehydrogenase [Methylophilales bacterium BACL14 MAG-120910-bin43]|jgi:isocitrate dehydrogenase|nr:MAG: isocitrate dehydrogenase [Methylophilales bacterium BACL14 MAG-120910-bin43]KRP08230.1 MAG: isocitrate dehydrogenase [Methylophilales bacterium BACL14 MAG-120920-bin58]MBT5410845.1 NADP-dependent isocitrate dehydrogenase [Nitrosomonadales bacterium]|tara:strand:- start:152 stop:1396 length:1245 start_codon:yes stop_codon:yes gene_type:complete